MLRASVILLICLAGLVTAQTEVCGGPADVTDYPYQLSFWIAGGFRCSAALLSVDHAISSAHCLNKAPVDREWTLRAIDGQERVVTSWVIHNNNFNYDYDVAILTVTEEWDLSGVVKPIALPAQGELLDVGDVTTVTAWIRTNVTGSVTELETMSMPILEFPICDAIYLPHLMTDRMYCAGRVEGSDQTCQLNTGSLMVSGDKLVGWFTLGNVQTRPDYPSSYTKVGEVRSWINATTGL